jgi:hypothetical protein
VWQFWQEMFRFPWGLRELCAGCCAPGTGEGTSKSHEMVKLAISLENKIGPAYSGFANATL